jgi:hypothetical protein
VRDARSDNVSIAIDRTIEPGTNARPIAAATSKINSQFSTRFIISALFSL